MTNITPSTVSPLAEISAAGVSIWLDDLSRNRITSGDLRNLIGNRNVVGVTTNPTIFAGALAKGDQYGDQVAELAHQGKTAAEAVFEITTRDVAAACDVFKPVYDATNGRDGRVSIEVEPGLAHDAAATIAQAKQLRAKVDRENVMIKIPATIEGLEAITAVTALGISVNVTLIFSLNRYREVVNAYMSGLERAMADGIDLTKIHSVASFFVSRVDVEIDKRLAALGTPEALALKGKAAIANARLAYDAFQQVFSSERWQVIGGAGGQIQRPLWASTGVKDPTLPDTLYVDELVAPGVVNTMPEKTLEAEYDHGAFKGNTIEGTFVEADHVLDQLRDLGISYNDVTALLESEGVDKFIVSWNELLETVTKALESANE